MAEEKFEVYFEYDPEVEAELAAARAMGREALIKERIALDWWEFTNTGLLGWFLDFFRPSR